MDFRTIRSSSAGPSCTESAASIEVTHRAITTFLAQSASDDLTRLNLANTNANTALELEDIQSRTPRTSSETTITSINNNNNNHNNPVDNAGDDYWYPTVIDDSQPQSRSSSVMEIVDPSFLAEPTSGFLHAANEQEQDPIIQDDNLLSSRSSTPSVVEIEDPRGFNSPGNPRHGRDPMVIDLSRTPTPPLLTTAEDEDDPLRTADSPGTNMRLDTPPAEPDRIRFGITSSSGNKRQFRIGTDRQLGPVLALYCASESLVFQTVRFVHEITRVHEHSTPRNLGMEEDDEIWVYEEQIGGQ